MDFLANIANTLAFALPDVTTELTAISTDIETAMTTVFPAVVAIVGIRKVGSFVLGMIRGA